MRSVTSFFNKTIFRNDYRRYWPIMFAYTLFWMALPISQWNQSGTFLWADFESNAAQQANSVSYDFLSMALIMAVFFGCFMAMAMFSYLMNSRAVGLMHSLPVRRGSLFVSHITAAMSMFVIGNLVVVLVTVLVQLGAGASAMRGLLAWLLVTTLLDFIFFSLAVLCCMFTGWLLAVPVLYLGLNTVAAAVTALVQGLGGLFYYGYDGNDLPALTMWLTPIGKLTPVLRSRWYLGPDGPTQDVPVSVNDTVTLPQCLAPELLHTLAVYAAAALVLLVVSYLLYRRRASESAADPIAVGWAKPIFRYGLAFLGGLAMGIGVYVMITANMRLSGMVHLPILLVCLVLMGMLCYFAVSMIIEKSFRVFGRGWLKAGAVALALVALCFVMRMDLCGYEQRVPDQKEIKTVTLALYQQGVDISESTDPQEIAMVQMFHREILKMHEQESRENIGGYAMVISYQLKNGDELHRRYFVQEAQISTLMRNQLEKLINSEKIRCSRITGYEDLLPVEEFTSGHVSDFQTGLEKDLTTEQAQMLYKAMAQDVADGAGHYQDGGNTPGDNFSMTIQLYVADGAGVYQDALPRDCKHTLEALEELGFRSFYWDEPTANTVAK